MGKVNTFVVTAKQERPKGEPERIGIIAADETAAIAMAVKHFGAGVGWDAAVWNDSKPRIGVPDIVYVVRAPYREPARSAADLFSLQPIAIEREPFRIGYWLREVDTSRVQSNSDGSTRNKRVTLRLLHDPAGKDSPTLGTLWLDDTPFAVVQSQGQRRRRLVTDWSVLRQAVAALEKLYEPIPPEAEESIDPMVPMRKLTSFYGYLIDLDGDDQ